MRRESEQKKCSAIERKEGEGEDGEWEAIWKLRLPTIDSIGAFPSFLHNSRRSVGNRESEGKGEGGLRRRDGRRRFNGFQLLVEESAALALYSTTYSVSLFFIHAVCLFKPRAAPVKVVAAQTSQWRTIWIVESASAIWDENGEGGGRGMREWREAM